MKPMKPMKATPMLLEEARWREQARFAKEIGAQAVEWGIIDGKLVVTKLVLLPPAAPHPNGLLAAPPPPAPRPKRTAEELHADLLERRQRLHDIAFAASSVRPILEKLPPPESVVPRAVKARTDARGATFRRQ